MSYLAHGAGRLIIQVDLPMGRNVYAVEKGGRDDSHGEAGKRGRAFVKAGVCGISVTRGKGYGEYTNFFTRGWEVTHVRLEIYCKASRAEEFARYHRPTRTGLAGDDGTVGVTPVEKVYRIRTGTEWTGEDV